ncbi:hypothetical protein FACS1894145_5100 [Bacteroidia bacterium]|nr:hypothetical protein FACS1894145_5100 [Bacteroidia bacterium]
MRVSIKFLLSSILFLSSWFCAPNLWADDFYWRKNPINGNFNDAANWSSTSTGAESGTDDVGRYPSTATDNVFFTTASSIVTLNQITGVVTIHNITCTAPAGTVYNLSTNTTYNINGSIQSNGNLTITNGTINMIGAENVTVDLGTSNPIAFGNTFTVNKANTPAQAKVTLINNDFKRTGSLSLQNGSFDNINNKNITATSTTFQRPDGTSDHITINLGASTLTLTSGQFTLHGKQLHPTCDVNLNDALKLTNTNYYGTDTIQFKSLTLGSAVRTMNISDNTVNLTLENLTVNTPSLTIISQDAGYFKTVNISDALTFNQPTDMIVNSMGGRPYGLAYYYSEYGNNTSTWNINDFVFPSTTDCTQRSSIIGFTPVTLNITGTALTTQNIIYKNITATGAGITASPTEDGGLNSGITFTGPATSKDYYWIGDTGNWDDPAHWKNNATGSSDGCIPSPIDNVFFDTNSFSATGQAATLRKPAFCKNISWVDAGKEGSLNVSDYSASMPSGNSLTIQGDADFSGAKVVQPGLYFLGAGDQTLNSGTDPVYMSPYIYFQAGAGTYTLTSDLIMSDASPAPYYKNPIIHTSGTLNSDGYTLDIGSFFSRLQLPAGSSRSINFTNSKIYVDIYGENSTLPSINLLNDGAGTYQFTGSQLFMNNTRPTAGNTDTRNLFRASGLFEFNDITFADGRRGRVVFDNANTKVRKLTFNGPVQASGNTSTCIVDSLILTPYKEYDFYTSTITITGGLDARTSGCQTITIGNPTSYVSTFVNNTTNEMSINGAIIKNTNYNAGESGYPQLQVPNGVDQGNNTNVNVTAAAPRDFYWVGGTGNWSDANHWSFTSGGPGNGTCLPALNDDVYFDQNSFSANNQVVTMDQALVTIHSMIWQPGAGTKTPVLALNSARLELYGSLELASGMQVNYGSIYFKGTGTGEDSQTIRTNNVSMPNTTLDFDSYGRFDLYGNLIVSYLYHRNGGFVTHNYNVTAPNTFWLSTTNGLPLDLGTSTLTGPFNWYIGNNGSSLNTADARLVSTTTQQARIVPNNQDIFFKSIVFNNRSGNLEGATSGSYAVHTEKLTFSPPADATSNSTINGNFVVDTLVISATAPFMKITQGRTLTINEETILENGTPCNYFYIQSTTLNSPAKIKFNHCNPTLYYVSLQDIDVDCSGATDCEEGVPNSELTVYGSAAAERVTGDVTITDPGRPAIINLAPVLSGCLPYNFLVPGKITSYDLVKKEGGTETTVITNGTARFIPIYESGDYRLDANYEGIDCEGIITQTITIKAYRTWTAMGRSNDWKDIANWDIDLLPDPCSYVIIPGGLRHYPVINKLDSAVCDIIDFKFGGEVKNTHLLTYNAAKFEINDVANGRIQRLERHCQLGY